MSDITITVTEIVDGVSVESTPTSITVFDGGFTSGGGGGGGGGAVDSVNGQTGTVVLTAASVSAQPVDSDLTAIAALSTTTFGRALLALADAAALRTTAGLGTAATQASTAFDAAGAAASAQAASQPLDSDLTAIAALTTTSFGRSLLTQANAAAARTTLGAGTSSLALGTTSSTAKAGDYQPAAANISDASTIGRTILTAADAAAVLTAIGAAALASPAFTGHPTGVTETAGNNSTRLATTAYADAAVAKQPEVLMVAVTDEATAITTGAAKVTFRMPFAMTLTAVRASLTVASSSGNPAVDINEGGSSIFSTTLTIDSGEKTSVTAATAAVISDSSLADDAEITVDIDTAGTGAKGLKISLIGTRT